MSFLSDIKDFSKSELKSASTLITTATGAQYVEKRDSHGRLVKTQVAGEGCTLGYLGDVKPDLQVGKILPHLILGSQDVAADLELLRRHGVTHILNVASLVDNQFPEAFTYKDVKILDIPETDIVNYFPECFEFINECAKADGCVLVHCNAGVSRAPSIIIGYLMTVKSFTFQEAYDYVKSKRPAIRPNDGFTTQLKQYKPQ